MEIRANAAVEWKPEYIASSDTLYGMSDKTKFRREIYCLEFSFKPLRMIEVDVPAAGGTTERKLVWYMVYRIRNTGQALKPVAGPRRRLFHRNRPRAAPFGSCRSSFWNRKIARRPAVAFRNRISIASSPRPTPRSASAKRPATRCSTASRFRSNQSPSATAASTAACGAWPPGSTSIRASTSSRSTSAVSRTPTAGPTRRPPTTPAIPPGRGRQFVHKMLQLNFWRPGDDLMPNEREFRYGVPLDKAALYDVGDGVAYRWLYR